MDPPLVLVLSQREPTVDLLDSFVDHWKSITNYYIQTTDETRPVKGTDIPWRLRQMVDILVYEEKQQGVQEDTGSCLEYLLEHKILETLCTLGKAQYPPGMSQQVLVFFSKLLSQIQKSLLHLVNVSRPVQKLIRFCALPGSQTEKEEAQFLLVVCSRVKQDPHVLSHVLEPFTGLTADVHSSTCPLLHPSTCPLPHLSTPPPLHLSTCPLLHLSPPPPVHSSTPPPVYLSTPPPVHCSTPPPVYLSTPPPVHCSTPPPVHSICPQRGSVCLKAYEGLLLLGGLPPGSSGAAVAVQAQLGALLSGRLVQLYSMLPLDTVEPPEVQNWPHTAWRYHTHTYTHSYHGNGSTSGGGQRVECVLSAVVLQYSVYLYDQSEQVVLVSTSVLCATVRLVRSQVLLDQLVHFLLGSHDHTLTPLLLQRCDHISDQISMVSLSLVEELLQKPHRDILDVLVLQDLRGRAYLTPPPASQEDLDSCVCVLRDLEEDPFFNHTLLLPSPSDSAPSSAAPRPESADDAVNSFLCLLPVQCRSAQLLQEGGYESYIHDAHTLVMECRSLSEAFDWPLSLPAPPSSQDVVFFEGHLLKVLLDRLGRILEQPYELNLQLTAVLSRLCAFRHPLLSEYLLDPYVHLDQRTRSLFSVLIRVMGQLMQRVQKVYNLSHRLLKTRRDLLGLDQDSGSEHQTLLRGVIVLEEFCKELAAIAFVKLTQDQDLDQD
uniref:Family with sequence similarity 160 member B2 n=1 Tax=Sphaeramia orbicularis TaxID=375764 RepID=A0A672YWA3_9TELE